jgi:hypothetical protein
MRLELDKQLLVAELLCHLQIPKFDNQPPSTGPYLKPFPAYSSPTSIYDPQYQLRPEEEEKMPLQLLQLAMLRVIIDLEVEDPASRGYPLCSFSKAKAALMQDITRAGATQQSVDVIFSRWMKDTLTSEHYWQIQTKGCVRVPNQYQETPTSEHYRQSQTRNHAQVPDQRRVRYVPLYSLGFWNLLSDYLSHNAITKVRDLGTFYHLISQNPNAAEWFVWWLINFGSTERLHAIFGGMETIVERLESRCEDEFRLFTGTGEDLRPQPDEGRSTNSASSDPDQREDRKLVKGGTRDYKTRH